MKIRVKYCGGCNPRYDRKAVTEHLRKEFPESEWIERYEDAPFDFVVVLCGCTAACANHADLHGIKGKIVVKSEAESQEIGEILRSLSE